LIAPPVIPQANLRSIDRNGWARSLRTRIAVTVLGGLILVTSSVAVSLGLSRLALGELFRLVRRSSQDAPRQ